MDGLRLLELIEEYRQARDAQKWDRAFPVDVGRPVEDIAREFEKTLRSALD